MSDAADLSGVPDATSVVAHSQPLRDEIARPLSPEQAELLRARHQELTGAIWFLQSATAGPQILEHVPTVLAHANAVLGTGDWEDHLASAYGSWVGTSMTAGTDEQFQRARDQIAHAAVQLAVDVEQWIALNDATMLRSAGPTALHRLAVSAAAAYEYLMVGPGSDAYAADHGDYDDGAYDDGAGDDGGEPAGGDDGVGDEGDDAAFVDERWEDDSEELL